MRCAAPVSSFCTNGNIVLSGCQSGVLKLWRLSDGQLADTCTTPDKASVTALACLGPLVVSVLWWQQLYTRASEHGHSTCHVLPCCWALPGQTHVILETQDYAVAFLTVKAAAEGAGPTQPPRPPDPDVLHARKAAHSMGQDCAHLHSRTCPSTQRRPVACCCLNRSLQGPAAAP